MSATASALAAFQPRRRSRDFWDKLPKPNSHRVRYCVRIQDALQGLPVVRAIYDMLRKKAARFDKERKAIEASLGDLCVWIGDVLRAMNPGESDVASEPAARSSVAYWLRRLLRFHLIELRDVDTGEVAAAPRKRGDGRHKSQWFVNSFDLALDLMVKDPRVAIPKNRCFWTRDGWPVDDEEAVLRELDAALAERMPEAWANNARAYNPHAPMKPLRRTVTVYAGPAEIATVQRVLADEPWKIAVTPEQARERLLWAREVDGADRVPADWIAAYLNRTLEGIRQRHREQHRYTPDPVHQIGIFGRDQMRGAANVWLEEERRRVAAEMAAQRAAAASETVVLDVDEGTGPGPPPEFTNLRTRLS